MVWPLQSTALELPRRGAPPRRSAGGTTRRSPPSRRTLGRGSAPRSRRPRQPSRSWRSRSGRAGSSWPVSGSMPTAAQRAQRSSTRTIASPTTTTRPIQSSSANGSPSSQTTFGRTRRASTGAPPRDSPRACERARPHQQHRPGVVGAGRDGVGAERPGDVLQRAAGAAASPRAAAGRRASPPAAARRAGSGPRSAAGPARRACGHGTRGRAEQAVTAIALQPAQQDADGLQRLAPEPLDRIPPELADGHPATVSR